MKGLKSFLLVPVIASFFFIVSQPALAAFPPPQGWYIEGNGGYSTVTNKTYVEPNVRKSGIGWNGNLGYKITTFFSGEMGYTYYFPTRLYNGPKIGQDNHYSYDIAAKAMLPLADSSVDLFAKLGVARVHSNTVISSPSLASGLNIQTGTKNVTGLYISLGGEYYFAPSMAFVLQWALAHGNSYTGDLNLFSGGFSYNFG